MGGRAEGEAGSSWKYIAPTSKKERSRPKRRPRLGGARAHDEPANPTERPTATDAPFPTLSRARPLPATSNAAASNVVRFLLCVTQTLRATRAVKRRHTRQFSQVYSQSTFAGKEDRTSKGGKGQDAGSFEPIKTNF